MMAGIGLLLATLADVSSWDSGAAAAGTTTAVMSAAATRIEDMLRRLATTTLLLAVDPHSAAATEVAIKVDIKVDIKVAIKLPGKAIALRHNAAPDSAAATITDRIQETADTEATAAANSPAKTRPRGFDHAGFFCYFATFTASCSHII